MARKTKEEKRVESAVDEAFKKHGVNKQFDIMDLSKITKAGEDAAKQGKDIEEAVKLACIQYAKDITQGEFEKLKENNRHSS